MIGPSKAHLVAIGRSLDVYYRDTARTARMDALHAQFVPDGGLAFDIGAHVGDRTGSFVRLGARVVAVEPQPYLFRALRLIYGTSAQVVLRRAAIGAEIGDVDLFVNSTNPTITTASHDLIVAAQSADAWQGEVWDGEITVPMTTLDALIAEHGLPDFVKIDVEGYELAVLDGLTTHLPMLSFEFTTIQRGVAAACLDRLCTIGGYRYNYSLGEDHALRLDTWTDARTLKTILHSLPVSANSGDIFARAD